MKNNNITDADKILGDFEDYCEIGVMTSARRSIFFRINAGKYLKIYDIKNALNFFKSAVLISLNEGYDHELEKLETIYLNYQIL